MRVYELLTSYIATVDRSAREFQRLADKHITPRIGKLDVGMVGVQEAYHVHKALEATPYQANRVLAVLSSAMRHAERLGMRPVGSNPCSLVRPFPERSRRRYMRPEEAQAILRLLKAHEESHPKQVLFLYLLLWTGARPDEIRRAKWSDLDGSVLTLHKHKTDRTGQDRLIYLPDAAVALLDAAPKNSALIVGRACERRLWASIRVQAGCPDLRVYDLRHTFASAALQAGCSLGQIGELLGHKSTQTTARYAHLMQDSGKAAAEATAVILRGMIEAR